MAETGKPLPDDADGAETEAQEKAPKRKRRKAKKKKRKKGGFGFIPPFKGGQFMQMLPLMMAMGSSKLTGMNAVNIQIQLMVWMIETWIDYLAAMQAVFERALKRLHGLDGGESFIAGLMGAEEDGEDEDW